LKLVDALFERPSMTLADAAKTLSITAASASATISKLVQAGIISEVTGHKRNRRFIAREILSVAHS
jgi:Fic family protein